MKLTEKCRTVINPSMKVNLTWADLRPSSLLALLSTPAVILHFSVLCIWPRDSESVQGHSEVAQINALFHWETFKDLNLRKA